MSHQENRIFICKPEMPKCFFVRGPFKLSKACRFFVQLNRVPWDEVRKKNDLHHQFLMLKWNSKVRTSKFLSHIFSDILSFLTVFQRWEWLILAYIWLDMDLHVRYMLGGHLLMIWNNCLDLLMPKEALTTFVHNMLIKQFFRHMMNEVSA